MSRAAAAHAPRDAHSRRVPLSHDAASNRPSVRRGDMSQGSRRTPTGPMTSARQPLSQRTRVTASGRAGLLGAAQRGPSREHARAQGSAFWYCTPCAQIICLRVRCSALCRSHRARRLLATLARSRHPPTRVAGAFGRARTPYGASACCGPPCRVISAVSRSQHQRRRRGAPAASYDSRVRPPPSGHAHAELPAAAYAPDAAHRRWKRAPLAARGSHRAPAAPAPARARRGPAVPWGACSSLRLTAHAARPALASAAAVPQAAILTTRLRHAAGGPRSGPARAAPAAPRFARYATLLTPRRGSPRPNSCVCGKPETSELPALHRQAKPKLEPMPEPPPPPSYQPDLAYRLATWQEAGVGEQDRTLYEKRKFYEMEPRVPGVSPFVDRRQDTPVE